MCLYSTVLIYVLKYVFKYEVLKYVLKYEVLKYEVLKYVLKYEVRVKLKV